LCLVVVCVFDEFETGEKFVGDLFGIKDLMQLVLSCGGGSDDAYPGEGGVSLVPLRVDISSTNTVTFDHFQQVYLTKNHLASVASSSSSSSPTGENTADDMSSTTETAGSRFRGKLNSIIHNVVFMGMSEHIDGYNEVHESL